MAGSRLEHVIDRRAPLVRPDAAPWLHMTWGRLLFLHWPVPETVVRAHVPPGLSVDTWNGSAWIGVTPFALWGARPHGVPPVPLVGDTRELNLRTYVLRDGVPGVWFFSLDASNPAAVVAARVAFGLPYFPARMALEQDGDRIRFRSRRIGPGARGAHFAADWTRGEALETAQPDSLEFFLIERYWLYARRGSGLYRARIHHGRWPLRQAELHALTSTLLEAHGLPTPVDAPLVHAQGADLSVDAWGLERVA